LLTRSNSPQTPMQVTALRPKRSATDESRLAESGRNPPPGATSAIRLI